MSESRYREAWAELDGTLTHPQFCRMRGEQFKECAKCLVERLAEAHGLSRASE